MGNYAVYHLEKGNTSSGGIGNHIDRKEDTETRNISKKRSAETDVLQRQLENYTDISVANPETGYFTYKNKPNNLLVVIRDENNTYSKLCNTID